MKEMNKIIYIILINFNILSLSLNIIIKKIKIQYIEKLKNTFNYFKK